MSWNFVESDRFPLDTLEKWKDFYVRDLQSAVEYLEYVQVIAKRYDLPNEEDIVRRATEDVSISLANLRKVYRAIALAKERNL